MALVLAALLPAHAALAQEQEATPPRFVTALLETLESWFPVAPETPVVPSVAPRPRSSASTAPARTARPRGGLDDVWMLGVFR